MNIRNEEEYKNAIAILERKSYVAPSLTRTQFVYSLLAQSCKEFDIKGVEAIIELNLDLNKRLETRNVADGYVFRGTFYRTGTKEETTGGRIGKVTFGFIIGGIVFPFHESTIVFENYSSTPCGIELGFLSDRIRPKILHTLETLKFLEDKGILLPSVQ